MRRILLFFIVLLTINNSYPQIGNSPYPIIFVHGLNSDESTWEIAITELGKAWNVSSLHNLNFVLNARGGDTTAYEDDVIIPLFDIYGNDTNKISKSNIYTINFKNFWNRDNDNPRINVHVDEGPGTFLSQSKSNESAIYKQGFALKVCIDSVLRVTGAEKVILVGHSMGGLAIREYLQRKDENGIHKWWVDSANKSEGHKVAKVLTLSTPHLGSNKFFEFLVGINPRSEAIRDLRYSYPVSEEDGAYLFTNFESEIPQYLYNNIDVNCNGLENDYVEGLSYRTSDNLFLSLPKNILYTWLVSKFDSTSDGCVDLDRQWLYDENENPMPLNISDTIMTDKIHSEVPFLPFEGVTKDINSIIRGLDEPDKSEFAYKIHTNTLYSGFITVKTKGNPLDIDFYEINISEAGDLIVDFNSGYAGVKSMELLSSDGISLVYKDSLSETENINYLAGPGTYYLKFSGHSYYNPLVNNYNFSFKINSISTGTCNFLYTVDPEQGKAHKIDLKKAEETKNGNNSILSSFNLPGSKGSRLDGIASDGINWYISHNQDNKIYVLDSDWNLKGEFWSPGKNKTDINDDYGPAGLSWYSSKLWITDMGAQRLYSVNVDKALQDGNCNSSIDKMILLPKYCYSAILIPGDIYTFLISGRVNKFSLDDMYNNNSLEGNSEMAIQTNQNYDRGIASNGQYLWIGGQNVDIKAYDLNTKKVIYSFTKPGSSLGGMFFSNK